MKECIVITQEIKENVASVIRRYEWEKGVEYDALMELIEAMGLDLRYDRNIGGMVFCEKD
jgi:hypothetical protein